MAGVDDLGHQQRAHGLPVPGPHILPLTVFQLLVGDIRHPMFRQGLYQLPVYLVPLLDQRHHGGIDPPQLFRRGEPALVFPGVRGHQG